MSPYFTNFIQVFSFELNYVNYRVKPTYPRRNSGIYAGSYEDVRVPRYQRISFSEYRSR